MANEPEKKSPKKVLSARIAALRGPKTQTEFARDLEVSQNTISNWENPDSPVLPSAESFIKLGQQARFPDNIWFFKQAMKQAGINESAAASVAATMAAGVPHEGAVNPLPRLGSDGKLVTEDETLFCVDAHLVRDTGVTAYIVMDEQSAREQPGNVFKAGDLIVMERNFAEDQTALGPHRNQIVVVQRTVWEGKELEESDSRPISIALVQVNPQMVEASGTSPRHDEFVVELSPITVLSDVPWRRVKPALESFRFTPTPEQEKMWREWGFVSDPPTKELGLDEVPEYMKPGWEDSPEYHPTPATWDWEDGRPRGKDFAELACNIAHLKEHKILGRFVGWFRPPAAAK